MVAITVILLRCFLHSIAQIDELVDIFFYHIFHLAELMYSLVEINIR